MTLEDLSREHAIEGSSNRSFGLVFTVVFGIVALWPVLARSGGFRLWAAVVAGVFLVLALAAPTLLAAPNRAWMQLGLLLGRVVSPVVLGLLFFTVFTPMGWVLRLMGKDPMRLKRDANATSYWVERQPPGPPADSLHNQF